MKLVNDISIAKGSKVIDVSKLQRPRPHAFWETKHEQQKTVAIWGLGNVAQYHAGPLKKLVDANFPNIKFVVFDRRPKEQNKVNIQALSDHGIEIADYYVVDDKFLDRLGKDINVDAAIIGAPTFAHLEIMKICAKKGIYVFDEKPLVLPWQLNDFSSIPAEQKKLILPADFMKSSEALNFGVDKNNGFGFFKEIGTITGVYSRFVENQTLKALIKQFTERAGLLKVKTSGGGIYLDMTCHENIKLDTILKAIFGKGLSDADIKNTFLADAKGLNEALDLKLKDPHAEVYGSVEYSLGGVAIYSDAGKGLGPSANANLKEWSFATHIHGLKGDLIISTGTAGEHPRDAFIYFKKNSEKTGTLYTGFGDKFGYEPAFKDFLALVFGDTNAMQFPRDKWEETTFGAVSNASRVYTHAGTMGENGEPGDLANMHYFNAGSFPRNASKIWIPPYYD